MMYHRQVQDRIYDLLIRVRKRAPPQIEYLVSLRVAAKTGFRVRDRVGGKIWFWRGGQTLEKINQ